VAEAGGRFVDAPVSGGVARAGTGDLLVMVGAEDAALADARDVLDALSATWHHVGRAPGDGQRMKLVNPLLCGVHHAVAAEALGYAERLGIDPAAALEVLSGGAAASFMLGDRGPRMVAGDFEPPRSAVDIFVKDLGLVVDAAPDVPLPLAAAARARFVAAHDAGMGRLDDSALIRLASTDPQT
jgi:3-hydroxyisobutyrate dehydrogenase/putative dehydrogenase